MSLKDQDYSEKPVLKRTNHVLKKETKNWLSDSIVFAFSKESYNEKYILQIIQEHPELSPKASIWNLLKTEEGENIHHVSHMEQTAPDNKFAFKQFLEKNLHNSDYSGKYVAFVNGVFQDAHDNKIELARSMYEQFGNTSMYIGKVLPLPRRVVIDTPDVRRK